MSIWNTAKVRIWQAAIHESGMPPAQEALDSLIQSHVDLQAERDELLAACKEALECLEGSGTPAEEALIAAIDKAERRKS